jgi:hypothetical protein
MPIADEVERTVRGIVAVAQHGEHELVVGQGFIDEAFPGRIDCNDAGLRPVGHRMRENARAAIRALKARRRHPISGTGNGSPDTRAGCDGDPQAVSASAGSRGGNRSRRTRKVALAKALIVGEAAGRQHDALARDDRPAAG